MNEFDSAQTAKQFIIAQIVAQAEHDGNPLSEVEQKIMFVSETGWTLPDIWKVNELFDRDYDQTEYELKIGAIVRHTEAHLRKMNAGELKRWRRAIAALQGQDHYLLLLLNAHSSLHPNSMRDRVKLVVTALVICLGILVTILLISR